MTICVSLAEMAPEQGGTVVAIQAGFGLTNRLDAMGIRAGVKLVKTSGSLFGGPVAVRLGNVHLALGHGMALKILVECESSPSEDRP